MRRTKRASLHSYSDRMIFPVLWEHNLVSAEVLGSESHANVSFSRGTSSFWSLWPLIWHLLWSCGAQKSLSECYLALILCLPPRITSSSAFAARRTLGKVRSGRTDEIRINETRDWKGWTVPMEISLLKRTRCSTDRCKFNDFVTRSNEEVYQCEWTWKTMSTSHYSSHSPSHSSP